MGRKGAGGERVHVDPRRSTRLKTRDESGNIIVMFAVFVPIFILVCAIAIDVGYWWVNAKKAQIAADACALAAAGDPAFPPPPPGYLLDHCRFGYPTQRDYVRTNLHLQSDPTKSIWHKSTTVRTPYKGDIKRVEAIVELKVNTFFGTYVGLDSVDIVRRAVAEKIEHDGDWAIYAHDFDGCEGGNGLEFDTGHGVWINGRVHSNSRYHVNSGGPDPDGPTPPDPASGDQFWANEGTLDKGTCPASLDPEPEGAAYGTGPEPRDWLPQDGDFEPWPAWFTPEQFGWPLCSGATYSAQIINIKGDKIELKKTGPTFTGPDIDIPHSGTVPSGTYCATEQLTTSDTVRGTVTLLSPKITIQGDVNFTPHAHNVLFFSVPNWNPSDWTAPDTNTANDGSFPSGEPIVCTDRDQPMTINAGIVTFAGTIFHPCGQVKVNSGRGVGGNDALVGTILGYRVLFNQRDFKMTGLDEFGGDTELALWE